VTLPTTSTLLLSAVTEQGLPCVQIITSKFEETLPHSAFPTAAQYAVETARQKALDVAQAIKAQPGPPVDLIISADTVSDGCVVAVWVKFACSY
jgi:predicted house-cleaning NTP pyrophosphatase (Maf/HAM1 superfamily)